MRLNRSANILYYRTSGLRCYNVWQSWSKTLKFHNFSHFTSLKFTIFILNNLYCGLWWSVVWSVVICGGLWWSVVFRLTRTNIRFYLSYDIKITLKSLFCENI